jgi:leader peptidase (prepilin peptidase)/N-methyltransferase
MSSDDFPLLASTIALAGLIGLFVGSFLNVVIYRSPLGLSVSKPRSFCPTCRRQLAWWENIPVGSWIALRGRCRTCHQPISIRYPLVELTTGVVFALVTWAWHGSALSAAYCVLAATMIAVGGIELDGQRSPLSVSATGTAISLLLIAVGAGIHQRWWVIGGSVVGTGIAFLAIASLRSVDPECTDARGHGRTALLVAGCWVGGLGLGSLAVGTVIWIAAYAVCMVGVWSATRARPERSGHPSAVIPVPLAFRVPLISALGLAMVASLIVGG